MEEAEGGGSWNKGGVEEAEGGRQLERLPTAANQLPVTES